VDATIAFNLRSQGQDQTLTDTSSKYLLSPRNERASKEDDHCLENRARATWPHHTNKVISAFPYTQIPEQTERVEGSF
jgi:hypothetical protein